MSLFQMQPLPSTDEEQPGPSSGLGHQQRPHCRRILTGTGLLVVLSLCWVALQKSPEFLARRFGAPSLVEGQPEAQEAWGMGKVWQWHKDRLEAYKIHKKTNWDGEQQKTANARWEVFDGKKIRFRNKPRVRREWRTLSDEMKQKVADAFWKVKTLTEAEGQALYGPNFHNHDDMLMLHSCATTDPRCDQGHFGPQFMTFHRALLLKYELALLAVDPSIEAMPYWNMAYDAQGGKYEMDPIKGIFTNNYFGDYYGNMGMANYQVTNGLFANWPIAHWTSERFGSESHMAKGNPCIEKEYFTGTTASVCDRCCMDTTGTCECDEETDTYSTFLRAHDDCTPWVARWPEDPDGLGKLGGTWKLVYNEEDFNNCTDIKQVRTWMEWQDCIEMSTFMCSQRFKRISVEPGFLSTFRQLILPQMQKRADAISEDTEYGKYVRKAVRKLTDTAEQESQYSDAFTSVLQEIMKQLCGDYMLFGFIRDRIHLGKQQTPIYPRFFHSQAHIKFGKDLLDVTTSPNEAAAFTGYHSDIDRSSMTWMINTQLANPYMDEASWLYPANQAVNPTDDIAKGSSQGIGKGISGPFAIYDVMACARDQDTYYQYKVGESPWIPGSLLNDVVNSGFPFKNLFSCDVPSRCDGGCDGYTHYDILYWTAPERTPYTYDTLEHYYYPDDAADDDGGLDR